MDMSAANNCKNPEELITDCIDEDSINDPAILLDSHKIDSIELDMMKGDAIGNTVYSAKWIINTLISLSKVHQIGWTNQLESDLCMLWDMSAEKDIVIYLVNTEFLKIAEYTLKFSKEPRLTEIILGIIGNMCCQVTVLETIGNNKEFTMTILNCLLSDDPETLIQIFRFLQAAMWDIYKNEESVWLNNLMECKFLGEIIVFILRSSTNDTLLTAATDLIHATSIIKSTDDNNLLREIFKIDELVAALFECFLQLMPKEKNNHSQQDLKVIENWLVVISSIIKRKLFNFENYEHDEHFLNIMDIMLRILHPYKHSYNLIPTEQKAALCIYECVDLILWFQCNEMYVISHINYIIIMIMLQLQSVATTNPWNKLETDPDDVTNELFKYLAKYWIRIIHLLMRDQIIEILSLCEHDDLKKLMAITEACPNMTDDNLTKLIEIKTCLELT